MLAIFFPIVSLAGTIRPDVNDKKYIEYGERHKCVLQVRLRDKSEDDQWTTGYGSCTVIAPRIAITAAHVVTGVDSVMIIKPDGKEVKVKYSAFPALFNIRNKLSEKHDIAVCYLEEEIKLDFYPELYREKNESGQICSIAGFGVGGNHNTGVTDYTMKKRAGSNVVDSIINEMLVCTTGEERKTSLEYLIAPGDSGGGLFIGKKLAGINSNVSTIHKDQKTNSDKNDFGCHTRVSNHVNWIDKCIEIFSKIESEQKIEQ